MTTTKAILWMLALSGLSATHALSAEQHVVVVLDDSGSMDETMRTASGKVRRIEAAKKALTEVLSNLPAGTEVGVLALNTEVAGSNWIVPLGPADAADWRQNIAEIRADGGTPLGEYLKLGADELIAARAKQIYGTYRLLVVTDGEANRPEMVDRYLPEILARGIIMDVIGVDMQSDHSLATRVHTYRRADDDKSLTQAISEVFAETSTEDQDAAADFEMLAALPDEFATEALAALTHRNDSPVGESFGDGASQDRGAFTPQTGSIPPGGAADTIASTFAGLICCLSPLAMLAVVAVVLLKLRGSSRRR
jgi:hypothetical protein